MTTKDSERRPVVGKEEIPTSDGNVRALAALYNRSSVSGGSAKSAMSTPQLDRSAASNTEEAALSDTMALQIGLLQKAIDLLKTHATEAGTNLARLRSLMSAEVDRESSTYKSLQRERWLEERRELDATKALWRACQHTEAAVTNDQPFFDDQQRAEERRRRWHHLQEEQERRDPVPLPSEDGEGRFYPLSRGRQRGSVVSPEAPSGIPVPTAILSIPSGSRLLPLALADKVDPEALERKPKSVPSGTSSSSSSTSSSNASTELRTPITLLCNFNSTHLEEEGEEEDGDVDDGSGAGTVTIFRSSTTGGTIKKSRKPSTSSAILRIQKVAEEQLGDVAMPDYVADLLSEFDGQTTVPTLSLLEPSTSCPGLDLAGFASPLSPDLSITSPPLPPITSPKSAPSTPTRPRRTLQKVPSKRFSGFFAKRPSMSSLRQSETPYGIHATQIPSRLGSSIDLVIPEDRPFNLVLGEQPEEGGRRSGGSMSASHANWSNSPTNPSGLNPKRYSESEAGSRVSLVSSSHGQSHEYAGSVTHPQSIQAPSTGDKLSTTNTSAAPIVHVQPPAEDKKFTARLKKRISALRF